MATSLPRRRPERHRALYGDTAGPALIVASALLAVTTLVGVLMMLAHLVARPEPQQLSALEIFGLMAGAVAGLTTALAFFALAVALSHLRSADAALRALADEHVHSESEQKAIEEILVLLRELRDNSLLSEPQRQEKLARQATEQRRALLDGVRSFLAKGEYHRAHSLVEEMARRFGEDSDLQRIREEVRTAREGAEKTDVDTAARKVEELIAISAWPRAEEIANELVDRHPDATAARQLASRVHREHQRYQDQQRMAAYAEIQRHTTRREWSHALGAARVFLERFPQSVEAEALRVQVETLSANAEIEERQRLEGQIKELVKQQRFDDALEMARDVIRRFPNSPQADALRSQLPRLQSRAQSVGQSA